MDVSPEKLAGGQSVGVAQPHVETGEAPGAEFWSPRIRASQPPATTPCSHFTDGETESQRLILARRRGLLLSTHRRNSWRQELPASPGEGHGPPLNQHHPGTTKGLPRRIMGPGGISRQPSPLERNTSGSCDASGGRPRPSRKIKWPSSTSIHPHTLVLLRPASADPTSVPASTWSRLCDFRELPSPLWASASSSSTFLKIYLY